MMKVLNVLLLLFSTQATLALPTVGQVELTENVKLCPQIIEAIYSEGPTQDDLKIVRDNHGTLMATVVLDVDGAYLMDASRLDDLVGSKIIMMPTTRYDDDTKLVGPGMVTMKLFGASYCETPDITELVKNLFAE